MTPLISICLPTLNARAFLEERMASILNQTCQDWELIVCDSHSVDGTWEYLQQFASSPKVHLHRVPREGLYAGWNECLRRSTGKFVHIAPADDTIAPGFLETLVSASKSHPSAGLLYTDYIETDEQSAPRPYSFPRIREFLGGHLNQSHIRKPALNVLLSCLFGPPWITMSSVLFEKSILEKTGMFTTRFGSHGDFAWALEAGLLNDTAYVPGKLATWRRHASQATFQTSSYEELWKGVTLVHNFLDRHVEELSGWWGQQGGWKAEVVAQRVAIAEESLGVYRHRLRTEPKAFLQNLPNAIRQKPAYVLTQFLTGLPNPKTRSSVDVAHELIRKLRIPYPPEPLEEEC